MRPLRWWREVGLIVVGYLVYSFVRNQFGSASVGAGRAYDNALLVIDVEQALRIYNEATVQGWFLGWERFLWFWNVYYGSLHFVVPVVALVLLFQRAPRAYRFWRSVLFVTTFAALVGFSLFPLMPPRLLCDCEYGAGVAHGFVDTMQAYGSIWQFGSGAMASVSNQYAAMPSLHVAWATWCLVALWPVLRSRWARALVLLHALATVFAVVVTANHYWLDVVGGLVTLGVGWALVTAAWRRWAWLRGDDPTAGSTAQAASVTS